LNTTKTTGLLAGLFLLSMLSCPVGAQTPSAAPPPAAETQTKAVNNSLMQARIARFNQAITLTDQHLHPEWQALQWLGFPAPHYRRLESKSNRVENPDSITIIAIEAGLMDDAIAGSRTELVFQLEAGKWVLRSVREAYKCRRGPEQKKYVLKPCP